MLDSGGEPVPLLTFNEAEEVGAALHDHWTKMVGSAPIERGNLAWADFVQFVARTARARVAKRKEALDVEC
jgi:predicted protein tyrosine phosphatase